MSDLGKTPRGRARRVRDQHRQLALLTTDLGRPDEPVLSDLIGRWNILDRGVRPLVVRSDGTFTLYDHGDGRTDGRWLHVSDTFVSLFVDGPKRHSLYSMPDGQVFLSRYALPGSVSTPELLFRSELSFEGNWETPYRASPYVPAPPTQMSLGADRTFCADLGLRGEADGSVVVWSGIWARTGDTSAVLDYVAWVVADGARRMASHGQTMLQLRDDGTMTVAALDDVFFPAPGTVRAEGDEPLATAEEPDVLRCPLAAEGPSEPADGEPDEREPDETARPAEQAQDVEVLSPPRGPADQESDVADVAPGAEVTPVRRRVRHRRAARSGGPSPLDAVELPDAAQNPASRRDVGTVELPALHQPDAAQSMVARRDVGTVELPAVDRPERPASPQDEVVTVELPSDDLADATDLVAAPSAVGAVVPVVWTTTDDGAPVVVVLYVDADGALQVGALPASADDDRAPTCLISGPGAQGVAEMLPVAATMVDGTRVVVVLCVDADGVLQVGAVPASGLPVPPG